MGKALQGRNDMTPRHVSHRMASGASTQRWTQPPSTSAAPPPSGRCMPPAPRGSACTPRRPLLRRPPSRRACSMRKHGGDGNHSPRRSDFQMRLAGFDEEGERCTQVAAARTVVAARAPLAGRTAAASAPPRAGAAPPPLPRARPPRRARAARSARAARQSAA